MKLRKVFYTSVLTLCISAACATPAFASTTSSYVVKKNDTLWSLAKSHHVSLSKLEAMNPHVTPNKIYPGMHLVVPSMAQSTPTKTKSASKTATTELVAHVNGQTLHFAKQLRCTATSYTASEADNPWGAVDYLGNPLKLGTVAVDPKVIPIGSTLYVTGYHFDGLPSGGMICHATDEGGSIKGKRIDMFIPTTEAKALDFGRQQVTVYILK